MMPHKRAQGPLKPLSLAPRSERHSVILMFRGDSRPRRPADTAPVPPDLLTVPENQQSHSGPRTPTFRDASPSSQGTHAREVPTGESPAEPPPKIRPHRKQDSGPTTGRFRPRAPERVPHQPTEQCEHPCTHPRSPSPRRPPRARSGPRTPSLHASERSARWTFTPKPGDLPLCRDDFAKPPRSTP